jgi:Putative Flp pilus-assembly TadE/G-like
MSNATSARQQERGHRTVRRRSRMRQGQIIVLTVLVFPVLLGFMGLSLDMGYIYHVKRRMQTAADAGALGASKELWRSNNSLVTNQAKNDTKLNGFTDGASGVTVTVNNPPGSGPDAGNSNFVEVIIAQNVPTFFLRVINKQSATVRARAVAGLVTAAQGCVIALDPTSKGALTVQGTSVLTTSCGVMVNSNNTAAIVENGGGCIYSNQVGVTGDWVSNGSQTCIYPSPITEVPPTLDPLAYLTPPAIPATAITTCCSGTLVPGRYDDGISISGGTVYFQPGTYILNGGGLKVTGGATLISLPGGVTFYNTDISGKGKWGTFSIAGNTTLNLVAPTDSSYGGYPGVLFWTDKNAPNKSPGNVIAGTSASSLIGAMYFPSTSVTYTGNSSANSWQMIVGYDITVSGDSEVYSNFGSTTVPVPTRIASLVE